MSCSRIKAASEWAEKANRAILPRITEDFDLDYDLAEWMRQWTQRKATTNKVVRGTLGRLLFGGDDVKKNVRVLSGGERAACCSAGKLILQKAECAADGRTDQPYGYGVDRIAEHGAGKYKGTLILSRTTVSSSARWLPRFWSWTARAADYYTGGYEDYLASKGIE